MTRQLRLAVIVVLVATGAIPAADEEGFKPLFNGKDLAGLKIIPESARDTFQVQDNVLVVSGKPNGYFYTDKSYANYHLKFEVKYPREAGNSGVLIHIRQPHKVWPQCVEAQGMHSDMGRLFSIAGAPAGKFTVDKQVQMETIKPVGQWNEFEVISEDGKLTTKINGKVVSEGRSPLTEGPIGWQSEGTEIHFRNIRLHELK